MAEDFALSAGSGFGFSISKGVLNVNQGGNVNFAIGAPFESSVVVFKTRKVVVFDPEIEITPDDIDPEQSSKYLV